MDLCARHAASRDFAVKLTAYAVMIVLSLSVLAALAAAVFGLPAYAGLLLYKEDWDAAAVAAVGGALTLLFGFGVVSEALADLDY
jgi:hypothetical protein